MEGQTWGGGSSRDRGFTIGLGGWILRKRGLLSRNLACWRPTGSFASRSKLRHTRRLRAQRAAEESGERKEDRHLAVAAQSLHRNQRAEWIEGRHGAQQQLGPERREQCGL